MKKLFLAIAACFAIGASAQSNIQWEGVAGFNLSNYGGLGSKPGAHFGAKAEFGLPSIADGVYLNAGALFSLEGYKVDFMGIASAKANAAFLDIPIHMGYRYTINDKVAVFGEAGPYVAVGLFGKISSSVDFMGEIEGEKLNTFDSMKRFDIGAGLKFGVEVLQKYTLSIGYDWGFMNLAKSVDAGTTGEDWSDDEYEGDELNSSLKSKNLTISIGYKF